ncbi:hypothetical protein [Streptomyces sp. NBC_01361]|uniref:hypothetical protein n=1 Tax=Streptomyces sp. NBC_01361 TaxID=2903838 RepID=UPI002E2F5641|nr:hypothetical protein [Streptomyces sp. NBC_01361]
MTAFQTYTTGTTALPDLDPYRFPAAPLDSRPEESSMRRGVMEFGDYLLPAPEPAMHLSDPLVPADRRRLELHATLTAAAIAPAPGDLDAIEALCALDDTTHVALRRWIDRTL